MQIPIHLKAKNIKKMYESLYEDLKQKYGLTMNEILFLLFLDKHKMKNTAREIVEELMVTKSHISKSVDSLAREKIIIRKPDAYDKKVIRLFINEQAKEMIKVLKKRENLINNCITKGISDEDLEIFNRVLFTMENNVNNLINKN